MKGFAAKLNGAYRGMQRGAAVAFFNHGFHGWNRRISHHNRNLPLRTGDGESGPPNDWPDEKSFRESKELIDSITDGESLHP
jgi:hypothetical protein